MVVPCASLEAIRGVLPAHLEVMLSWFLYDLIATRTEHSIYKYVDSAVGAPVLRGAPPLNVPDVGNMSSEWEDGLVARIHLSC